MQQPPQPQLQADSVADMKRELKQRLEAETTSSSPDETNTTTSETGSEPNAAAASAVGGEYQTMERSPLYESSTFRPAEGRRALPTTPPAPTDQTIPSVPGYAKPYARPFQPPPDPPASKPPRSFNYAPEPAGAGAGRDDHRPLLLETSLDDDTLTRRQKQPVRSRSVGQILETNLDDDVDQGGGVGGGEADGGGTGDDAASHSRSLGGDKFPRLSATQPNSLLESDL